MFGFTSLLLSIGLSLNTANSGHFHNQNSSFNFVHNNTREIYTPPNGHNVTQYTDNFENNNSISDATNLCPPDYYLCDSYHTHLEASIHYDYILNDVDYYYFNIFVESYVEILIESFSSNFSVSFALQKGTSIYDSGNNYATYYDQIEDDYSTSLQKRNKQFLGCRHLYNYYCRFISIYIFF